MYDYGSIIENTLRKFNTMSDQNKFIVPLYSKRQIIEAGKLLVSSRKQFDESLDIVANWRNAHEYPLHGLEEHLKSLFKDALVISRLKRMDSIMEKLKRFPNMDLYHVQDLGGCRLIVDSIAEVYASVEKFKQNSGSFAVKREYDYIKNPKDSGYRSYHLVCKYCDPLDAIYSKGGMLLEIQFRTVFQHVWATAVEILGYYTRTGLKINKGDDSMLRFLVVMSKVIAMKESGLSLTDARFKTIADEIKMLDEKLHVAMKLKAMTTALLRTSKKQEEIKELGYYVLQLGYEDHVLNIHYFRKSEARESIAVYNALEQTNSTIADVVMVSADSFDSLKRAYPNYFTDVEQFLLILDEVLAVANGECGGEVGSMTTTRGIDAF